MLPNPLTPPSEYSTEAIDVEDNGATLPLGSSAYPVQQIYSIATPTSDVSMGFDNQDERVDMEDTLDFHDLSDEDQDMSDGGAALTMTVSHVQQLNAEMDMLDAEVMGTDNLVDLLLDNQFQSTMIEEIPFNYPDSDQSPPHFAQASDGYDDEEMDDAFGHGAADMSNLPATMSEVSQQLQHLQDGQEHAEVTTAPDAQHGAFLDNSTSPFLFHSLSSTILGGSVDVSHSDYISLPDISSAQQEPLVLGSLNAPHVWGTEGWTPSPAMDVLVPTQNHQGGYHFASSDVIWDDDQVSEADQPEVEDQFNLSLSEFLYNWGHTSLRENDSRKRSRGPAIPAVDRQREMKPVEPVTIDDLHGEKCDIQRLDWAELGVSRLDARQMRRQTYKNYTNLRFSLQWHPRLNGSRLSDHEDYFRFRRMDFDHNIHLSHFQLRNLMACASRDHIFYAGRSVIYQYNRFRSELTGPTSLAMDLTDPIVQPVHSFSGGIQISTLTVAHGMLVAGGFQGEYGMVNLKAHKDTKHTEGIVTNHANGITNHIQVHLSRTSSAPVAAFASNDASLRILDINTNKFIAEHKFEHAINCSALSPDQRLRVLVGDNQNIMICNAETGEILQDLEGHRDYGFACDWADDGWTVATGNQDMQVKIWDARKWKNSTGIASPIATIAAEMAGVRKLKFSPLGSGKKVLIAAEPADFVNVIDAEMFASKQTLSFFGEIGGVDFTNDGQDLIVANCDNMRGGIMEFERCNFASGGTYGLESREFAGRRSGKDMGYDWRDWDEEIVNNPKSRGTAMHRRRQPAMLGTTLGFF